MGEERYPDDLYRDMLEVSRAIVRERVRKAALTRFLAEQEALAETDESLELPLDWQSMVLQPAAVPVRS